MSYKLLLADLIAIFIGFYLGYFLRIRSGLFSYSDISFSLYTHLVILSFILTLIVFLSSDAYKERRSFFKPEEFFSIAKSYLLVFIILMALTYLTKGFNFSRLIIFFAFILSIIFSSFFRYCHRKLRKIRKRNIIILGQDKVGERILKKIQQTPELGYVFLGFITDIKNIPKQHVDTVFVTKKTFSDLQDFIEKHEYIEFKFVSDFANILMEPVNFEEFSDIPLIEIKRKSVHPIYLIFKRFLDVIFAFFLLIFLSPILLFIVVLIKLTSKGPAIIRQQRLGYKEKLFTFYKFRTMHIDAAKNDLVENNVDYLFKQKNDPRITAVGKFLRRFCVDELPQLYNVLRGDMSLVGPRPHFIHEMKPLKGFQRKRFDIRPGMTGLWQISGRHDLSFERTILLDIYYVKHISFLLDMKILLRTIPSILFSRGYW